MVLLLLIGRSHSIRFQVSHFTRSGAAEAACTCQSERYGHFRDSLLRCECLGLCRLYICRLYCRVIAEMLWLSFRPGVRTSPSYSSKYPVLIFSSHCRFTLLALLCIRYENWRRQRTSHHARQIWCQILCYMNIALRRSHVYHVMSNRHIYTVIAGADKIALSKKSAVQTNFVYVRNCGERYTLDSVGLKASSQNHRSKAIIGVATNQVHRIQSPAFLTEPLT